MPDLAMMPRLLPPLSGNVGAFFMED